MSDCVIIGGGLIGMLTAHELSNEGLSVTLLERGELAKESSWAGGGILSPLYPWRYPEAVTRLVTWSQQQYPQLCTDLKEQTGIDPEWIQSGLLILETDEVPEAQQWAKEFGVDLEVHTEHPAQLEQGLGKVSDGFVFMPKVAQVRNPRFAQALKSSLQSQGVTLVEHAEVTDLHYTNGRMEGVQTTAKKYETSKVVVAGGAWSANILRGLNTKIDIQPVCGQMLLFAARPGLLKHILLKEEMGQARYLIPRKDGRILAGSTIEHKGFDKSTTQEALAELRKFAVNLLPALADVEIEKHWAGLRPGSPQGIPWIGEHPEVKGLFVNTGHFRNGVAMSPASAQLVTDLILNREPHESKTGIDPKPYAIGAVRT